MESLREGLDTLVERAEHGPPWWVEQEEEEEEDDKNEEPSMLIETYSRVVKGEPSVLELSLVGSRHSLWGHRLWNAARHLADRFDREPHHCHNKNVLELGAGAGLPSLICALVSSR